MTRTLAAAFATALLMAAAPASAQTTPPPGSQEACTPDVMRLCSELVSDGDHGKIRSCLAKKRRALSPECRAFFGGKSKRRGRKG